MIDPVSAVGYGLAVVAGAAWLRERRRRRRSQSSNQSEEQRFSELLERLGIGHWVRHLDTGQMWWSAEFRRMHGIDPSIPADRAALMPHIFEDDRAWLSQALEQAYGSGHGEIRYRSVTPAGDVKHHLVRIAVATSPEGARVGYGFNLDLTEQVRLQDQLAERSAYLEAIVRHLPMGISVFDHRLKLRFWNDGFSEVLNLPRSLVTEGVDFGELVRVPALRGEYGEGDIDELVEARRALALRFQRHWFERTRPNGRTHLVIGEPILRDEQVIGFVTTYTDITEQQREREQLQKTSEMLRALIENMPAGVSMIDADLRVVAWNQRLLEVLDFPPALFEADVVTLRSLFEFNIRRGEYGDIDDPDGFLESLLERSRQFEPHTIERTRPTGRRCPSWDTRSPGVAS